MSNTFSKSQLGALTPAVHEIWSSTRTNGLIAESRMNRRAIYFVLAVTLLALIACIFYVGFLLLNRML
jgi:hypothetical protein